VLIRSEQGPAAERAIAAAGLVPDAAGRFRTQCPACRAPIEAAALLPVPPAAPAEAGEATAAAVAGGTKGAAALQQQHAQLSGSGGGKPEVAEAHRLELPPEQLAALRAAQLARAAAFARQRRQVQLLGLAMVSVSSA